MANNRNKAIRGEDVELSIQYYGPDGLAANADATPELKITDPDGATILATTSTGVSKSDTGLYVYTYSVSSTADKGLWTDTWTADVDGVTLSNEFKFLTTDEASAVAGTATLGDDVEFDFSESELTGLNILLKILKAKLRSDGQKPSRDEYGAFITDGYGELVMEDCNVFSDELLACFLCSALSEFNMIPFFTAYTFADEIIYKTFSAAITEGAHIVALASQSMVEKGRDFQISDGGISYQPPALGDFLQSQYQAFLTSYRERLKFIKNSIRPGPASFGTFTNLSSGAPAFVRLRHLRSRRII
ncbi:hypothetical protein CMI47_03080 [Candidatus Pacearchaeota archaeon]|nr:hypothetical protein [Candidatus Pacearchaeota archaeon]|tara:strand:- start:368 stop:1276 length:909 start_codon:yes stop_codon:yes gene_type:complete